MVVAAWANARLSYAGWVPNVGSHLSFSLMGSRTGTDVQRFSIRQKLSSKSVRSVCALQRRTVDDFLVPPWMILPFRRDIAQDWLLIGKTDEIDVAIGIKPTAVSLREISQLVYRRSANLPRKQVTVAPDEQGVLIGRIYVVPYERHASARERQNEMLGHIRRKLTRAARYIGDDSVIGDIEQEVVKASPGRIRVDFALMRTGEVRIWFGEERAGLDEHAHDYVARQAYFFIKDMTHRHFHHHPAEDQITPLVRFDGKDCTSRRESEIAWRRETLWSLARYAEKRMGSERLNELREAVGMLAYADAFQKTLLDHIRDPDDPLKFVPNSEVYGYDFAHIRESTRVRIDQTNARRTVTGQLLAAMFAGGIASMSLLSSLVSTTNARHANDRIPISISHDVLRWGAEHPVSTIVISAILLFTIFALNLSDVLFNQPRRRAQGLRGLTLSLAQRQTLSSKATYRILVLSYAVILIGLLAVSVWVGGFIANGHVEVILKSGWSSVARWASQMLTLC